MEQIKQKIEEFLLNFSDRNIIYTINGNTITEREQCESELMELLEMAVKDAYVMGTVDTNLAWETGKTVETKKQFNNYWQQFKEEIK